MMNNMRFSVIIRNGFLMDRDIDCYNITILVYRDIEKKNLESHQ